MTIEHLGKKPIIDDSAFVAKTAVVCGDVKVGKNARIMYGATVIAEDGTIEIGDNCVVLENAVLRSTAKYMLKIQNNVLIGPNAHVVGCMIEDNVFIATGAAVFHGARLCKGSEVRINGVVHLRTVLPADKIVPIGWIAVGDPVKIFPPNKHDEIWSIQKELNFPKFVYDVDRKPNNETIMPEIVEKMVNTLSTHKDDEVY